MKGDVTRWTPATPTAGMSHARGGHGMFDVRSTRYFTMLVATMALTASPRTARAQSPTNQELLQRIAAMEAQLIELKNLLKAQAGIEEPKVSDPEPEAMKAEDRVFLDYLHDLKYGGSLDTYYGFNFNRPLGRVNLLRAYDVTSNNFSLNQASVVLESAPDVEAGRRFGARSICSTARRPKRCRAACRTSRTSSTRTPPGSPRPTPRSRSKPTTSSAGNGTNPGRAARRRRRTCTAARFTRVSR
jgi:hypothetical protein